MAFLWRETSGKGNTVTHDPSSQHANIATSSLEHDHWSRIKLEIFQTHAFEACREYAYMHSPFYQRFHQGLTRRPLQELPVLTKTLLMEHFDEIVTDQAIHLQEVRNFLAEMHVPALFLGQYRVMATSGSTGEPGIFLFDRSEGEVIASSFARFLSWAGVTPGRKMAVIASTVPRHMSSNLAFVINGQPLPKKQFSANIPVEQLNQQLNGWQPDGLAAYPSIMRVLVEEQRQGRLSINPRFLFCASETLTEETRRWLVDTWQVQPFNIYAATECGVLAAECSSHQGLHLFEDLVILEIVDHHNQPVPPGTYGARALLTTLFRRVQPLIRYELSDSICRSVQEICACGRPFHLLKGIQGRSANLLSFSTPSGEQVEVNPHVFSQIMDSTSACEWQIVQMHEGLRILLRGEQGERNDEALLQALQQALISQGVSVPPLWIEHVAVIPRTESGKVIPIVSAL
jgi:putative adenylate-forming enzyme